MPDRDVPRVLVVDDDARVRRFLTSALGAAGFAVTATGIGAEGLRLADSRPDLIVLDVELPDLSGREVCRRLKAAEETAAIPVLMLSGVFTDVADRSQALEDGSDAYLTKPFSAVQLMARLKAALRLKDAQDRTDLLTRHLLAINHELEQNVDARDSDLIHARNALVLALA